MLVALLLPLSGICNTAFLRHPKTCDIKYFLYLCHFLRQAKYMMKNAIGIL
jgi:hypothetical protein